MASFAVNWAGSRRSRSSRDCARRRTGTWAARMPGMLAGLGILSFAVAWVVLRLLLSRFRTLVLDKPNERSLHERPVPRTGGVAGFFRGALCVCFGSGHLWFPVSIVLW